ncbi:MAG: caspase family protein [Planctomycetota bacterium]|nr:caspase family protein [Planctomycetota bacterium]
MPDLHVFIAGVSEYVNLPDANSPTPLPPTAFGLCKLASPALSAFCFYQWLQNNRGRLSHNLKFCRLLLSPSGTELAADADLHAAQQAGNVFQTCSLANFLQAADDWRKSASSNRDDMAWFFFSGHGVERTHDDAVMLLDEFGQGLGGALINAVDLKTLFYGMAPSASYPEIARRQLYFVDACRMLPNEFKKIEQQNTSQVFQVELPAPDDRVAPTFMSAISGAAALGFSGRPSFFSDLLIKCLNRTGATSNQDDTGAVTWAITTDGIRRALKDSYDSWRDAGLDVNFTPSGLLREELKLLNLDGRPDVEVRIQIDPIDALPFATLSVTDMATQLQLSISQFTGNPTFALWPAGYYRIEFQVQPNPVYRSPPFWFSPIEPPRPTIRGRMT